MISRHFKTHILGMAVITGLMASCSACCNDQPPELGQITVHPDKVEVDQTATLTVSLSKGGNLQPNWKAEHGTVSNSTESSATYKAPSTEGKDIVTLTLTNCAGSTTRSVDVQVVRGPPVIDLTGQFIPNDADRIRELMVKIRAVPGLTPQDGQKGVDLRGYKLEVSLQGKAYPVQLFFKDCKDKNAYGEDSSVGLNLSYDPALESGHAVRPPPDFDFSHICLVGVKAWPNSQGVKVVSARLVKVR